MNVMTNTVERLLDLGETAICSRGYAGFSYGDIAAEAGIRKASIHHHFPTKLDFGKAILDRYADNMASRFNAIDSHCRTGAQAMTEVIRVYRDALGTGDRMCLCVALSADTLLISEEIRQLLDQANRMTADWLEQVLVRGRRDRSISVGGDPALEAFSILAQLQGAQLIARAAADPAMFDKAISSVTARLSRH